jgi:aconitase B
VRLISRARATELLGTMLGGYNISPWSTCWTTRPWLPKPLKA